MQDLEYIQRLRKVPIRTVSGPTGRGMLVNKRKLFSRSDLEPAGLVRIPVLQAAVLTAAIFQVLRVLCL